MGLLYKRAMESVMVATEARLLPEDGKRSRRAFHSRVPPRKNSVALAR